MDNQLFQHGLLQIYLPTLASDFLDALPKTKSVDWVGSQHFQNAEVEVGLSFSSAYQSLTGENYI